MFFQVESFNAHNFFPYHLFQIPHTLNKRLFNVYANYTARGSEDKIVTLLALTFLLFSCELLNELEVRGTFHKIFSSLNIIFGLVYYRNLWLGCFADLAHDSSVSKIKYISVLDLLLLQHSSTCTETFASRETSLKNPA